MELDGTKGNGKIKIVFSAKKKRNFQKKIELRKKRE